MSKAPPDMPEAYKLGRKASLVEVSPGELFNDLGYRDFG